VSKSYYELYGEAATALDNLTEVSGRYGMQAEAERRITRDVSQKLRLKSTDRLLEIGCGVGNVLIPLSFFVASATGVDHPKLVGRLQKRFSAPNLHVIAGEFPELQIVGQFDKILVYSVLHCLHNEEEVLRFVAAACRLLSDKGRMLLGDIPCLGRKKRFLESQVGRNFNMEWSQQVATQRQNILQSSKAPTIAFTDEFVLAILGRLRNLGWHSYIVEQPSDLAFGLTREDILVVGPNSIES
jgi:cyclopropane fatty-acyl-phospholipid synthase-like methyltransferase